jgi:hypothetical protein
MFVGPYQAVSAAVRVGAAGATVMGAPLTCSLGPIRLSAPPCVTDPQVLLSGGPQSHTVIRPSVKLFWGPTVGMSWNPRVPLVQSSGLAVTTTLMEVWYDLLTFRCMQSESNV